jgi:hypothetical protein
MNKINNFSILEECGVSIDRVSGCIRLRNYTLYLLTHDVRARAGAISFLNAMTRDGCGDLDSLAVATNKPLYFDLPGDYRVTGLCAVCITENGGILMLRGSGAEGRARPELDNLFCFVNAHA